MNKVSYITYRISFLLIAFYLLLLCACKDYTDSEVYKPPSNLEGKLFDQISLEENDDLSIFASCLELSGISKIINKTGYFTVFAPTNEAFSLYFDEHPEYGGDVEQIPAEELEKLMRFHIIQNGWTIQQLKSLDALGWINPTNPFYNKPKGFKRATILLDSLKKEWIKQDKFNTQIVNEASANAYRVVVSDSRKYASLFYQEYFSIFDYSSQDYEFYFNRTFEGGESVYYVNGKILSREIAAENGFVYKIDRVVEPMNNLQQIFEADENYHDFLSLIYKYPEFEVDLNETFNQEGVSEGLAVDTLYSLSFPDLAFSINAEETGPVSSTRNFTIREHNTVIAPTNAALQYLYDNIVLSTSGYPHYTNKDDVPDEITKIIINSHLSTELLYQKDMIEGFRNGEKDLIRIDPSSTRDVEYGSNGVFLGTDEAIIPFAFESVAAPVYLRPGYQTFFYAIETANILPALTLPDADYSFYILEDLSLEADSSLLLIWEDREAKKFHFDAWDRSQERFVRIRQDHLTKQLMNQIVVDKPHGVARREFLENLGGNFIVLNNEDGTVQGGRSSVFGYEGDSIIILNPVELEEPSKNGITYEVEGWFLNTVSSLYSVLARESKFLDLLDQVGLAEKITFRLLFLSETENYTVFVPSNEALTAYGVDTMSNSEIEKMLLLHFVKGNLIFTDGKKSPGDYETMQIDVDRSDQFNTYYSTLNIIPGIDEIQILKDDGGLMHRFEEAGNNTNVMGARDVDEEGESRYDFVTNSVVHFIDSVLVK